MQRLDITKGFLICLVTNKCRKRKDKITVTIKLLVEIMTCLHLLFVFTALYQEITALEL